MAREKHSEHFFTDARSFWWNEDFLKLMAERWGLDDVRSALDIGCGVGDWTNELLKILPEAATLSAVDREPEWVVKSRARFARHGGRVNVLESCAEKLPFQDASFDFVSCQTLLIHVANPSRVIREMLRVLRPGGLLAVAEPSNTAQTADSIELSVDERTALFRLNLICERGKIALGEGNSSLGDLLPGLFAEAGLDSIQVFTSDKAAALWPPYDVPGQKEQIVDRVRDADSEYFMFGPEQTLRFFLAGGGNRDEFEHSWRIGVKTQHLVKQAIAARSFHSAGGFVMYLVSGRKK